MLLNIIPRYKLFVLELIELKIYKKVFSIVFDETGQFWKEIKFNLFKILIIIIIRV